MIDFTKLAENEFDGAVSAPDEYPAPRGFKPLEDATYTLRIAGMDLDEDEDGNLRNKANPQVILTLEVAEGAFEGRVVNFIRVRSNRYERAPGKYASELGDLVRAFDPTFNWMNSIRIALEFLQQQSDLGRTFRARMRWAAFDSDYWNENKTGDRKEDKMLSRQCTKKGMKKFPPDPAGGYLPEWEGPSGRIYQANLEVAQYIEAGK